MKRSDLLSNVLNIVGFQAGWFAAVIGTGQGIPLLGMVAVPLVLVMQIALSQNKKAEIILILTAGVFGFCFDTLLVLGGIITPVPYLFPVQLSPPWMVLLWMNFAAIINSSLKQLHGRYLLSALLGSLGGPAAYYGGAQLGAMAALPDTGGLLILSVAWAAAVPLLYRIAARINRQYTGGIN